MVSINGIAEIAAAIGDPARAGMLIALMDGRALTAAELARAAGVTAQTASSHLARLTDAGMLVVERQGRHRYHRLASPGVAQMVEGIMAVAPGSGRPAPRPLRTGPGDQALRRVRTCYDHLAGRLAVAMGDRMAACGQIDWSPDGGVLTPGGAAFLRGIGVDLDAAAARNGRGRIFCRPCLDWSERRPHVAGVVGAALRAACFAQGWLRPVAGSRAVEVTPPGRRALDRAFAFDAAIWRDDA